MSSTMTIPYEDVLMSPVTLDLYPVEIEADEAILPFVLWQPEHEFVARSTTTDLGHLRLGSGAGLAAIRCTNYYCYAHARLERAWQATLYARLMEQLGALASGLADMITSRWADRLLSGTISPSSDLVWSLSQAMSLIPVQVTRLAPRGSFGSQDVYSFLHDHPLVAAALPAALSHIRKHFGDDARVEIDTFSDPDGEGEVTLFLHVMWSGQVDDAMERLRAFDEEWYLEQSPELLAALNVTVDFQACPTTGANSST